jgi:integrase
MDETLSVQQLPFTVHILAGNIAASSLAMYERDFKAYLDYAQTAELARRASTLARWRTELVNTTTMSPNTINRMLSAVKRLMSEAAQQDYITHEEAEAFQRVRGVKVDAMKPRMRISNRVRITPEDMRQLIDSIDTSTLVGLRNKALFLTLASSGLRVKELSRLTQAQIIEKEKKYLLHMYAEEGKNQKEDREAHISPEAVEAIRAWLDARPVQSPYIFTSFQGRSKNEAKRIIAKPISPQGAWLVVKNIAAPLIPDVKPHDFRRFVGTQVIKQKGITYAQKALGHKSIATTTKYDLSEIEPGVTDNLF